MDKNIFYGTHNNFIYITEKEPINDKDWYLIPNTMMTPQTVRQFDENDFGDKERALDILNSLYGRKVVLTNDPNLMKDGVQEVPEDFMIWLVKNPIETIEVGINQRIPKGYNYGLNPNDEPPTENYYVVIIPAKPYVNEEVPYDYLDGFIEQFHPDNGEFGIDDWTAIDFLEWLKLNKFKVIK